MMRRFLLRTTTNGSTHRTNRLPEVLRNTIAHLLVVQIIIVVVITAVVVVTSLFALLSDDDYSVVAFQTTTYQNRRTTTVAIRTAVTAKSGTVVPNNDSRSSFLSVIRQQPQPQQHLVQHTAAATTRYTTRPTCFRLYSSSSSSNSHLDDPSSDSDNYGSRNCFDATTTDMLRHRMYPIQIQTLEEIYKRSSPITTTSSSIASSRHSDSHSNHSPMQFIELCLNCLYDNHVPFPDSGIRYLLRISTKEWQQQIYQSIGYNYSNCSNSHRKPSSSSSSLNDSCDDHPDDDIISAISTTMSQTNNQFGILVGDGEPYRICFPSEPLEYEVIVVQGSNDQTVSPLTTTTTTTVNAKTTTTTSTIWVECQMRHYETNELLVMMGWQLHKDTTTTTASTTTRQNGNAKSHKNPTTNVGVVVSSSSSYKIDRMDWQDFREQFRPGIGREEWVRICG